MVQMQQLDETSANKEDGPVLTGDAFVGVLLFLVSAVLLDGVFGDGLHLNAGSVGQHAQILKQALPRRKNAKKYVELYQQMEDSTDDVVRFSDDIINHTKEVKCSQKFPERT